MPVKRSAVSALVLAETISVLGTRMTYLALPWFVLVTTGSPGKMSLVLAAEILPMAILGIPERGGRPAARVADDDAVADFARAPILASIPLLYSAGILSFGLLLAIVALLGCFMPPYFASQRTILPELVGEDETRMSQANSSIEGGTAFAALIGPVLAGVLIPFIGAPNVLYVDAATYLVAFVLVFAFVPRRKPVAEAVQHGVLAGYSLRPPGQAACADGRDGRGVRIPQRRYVGRASRVRLRRVRRKRVDRRPLLRRARSRCARGKPRRRVCGAKDPTSAAGGARHPGVRGPAVGTAVPASVAGRLRRSLRSDVLHAARERADARRPHRSHAGEPPARR